MKPIFFTIDNSLPLKVVPDTQAHLDGHTVIAYNYNIFFDSTKNDPAKALTQNDDSDKMTDPDYYGYVTFEKPGHVFSYTPGAQRHLSQTEMEEVIEKLNDYRDNPRLWDKSDI
jgi:hypothetical protein